MGLTKDILIVLVLVAIILVVYRSQQEKMDSLPIPPGESRREFGVLMQ